MATKSRSLSISKRGLNFEMLMWFVTRLTALAMYALILFAVIAALVMGARTNMNMADVLRWGFMPNVTHVQSTDLQDTAAWATQFWKLVGSTLLFVAAAHGVHGMVVVADDYIVSHAGRNIVRVISILFMLTMIGIGLYVIWTS
jgi:succinate dehydrogenase hydrophobic anchor subunit